MITAGILLAAGLSQRFGLEDKLLAPLSSKPLVCHAADALRCLAPDILIAVTSSNQVATRMDGFRVVRPDAEEPAQSASLRAGIALSSDLSADRALVVLGDMPYVGTALMARIVDRCTTTAAAAACDWDIPKPPVCWPRIWFPKLLDLRGDTGARMLLHGLPPENLVPATAKELSDIDTGQDLIAAQAAASNTDGK